MRRSLLALTAAVFAMSIGVAGTALAGGSADSSGDGFHCYLFFEDGGFFAQAMMNDEFPEEVVKKRDEFIEKYTIDEGLTLTAEIGNLDPGEGVCSDPDPSVCSEEEADCGGTTRVCSINGVCQGICTATIRPDGTCAPVKIKCAVCKL